MNVAGEDVPSADDLVPRVVRASGNSDITKGFQFCATLDFDTPLEILNLHWKIHAGPADALPPCTMRQGIWVPALKSWKDLGFPHMRELSMGTMPSPWGQVPADGGDLLPFLKARRAIIEGPGTREEKILRYQAEVVEPKSLLGHVNWRSPRTDDEVAAMLALPVPPSPRVSRRRNRP